MSATVTARAAAGLASVAMLLALTSAVRADRIHPTMEACNASCHGICFMQAEGGSRCCWGALKQQTPEATKLNLQAGSGAMSQAIAIPVTKALQK